jgi:hypothetical protein
MDGSHRTWRHWHAFFAARSSRAAPRILADDPRLEQVPASVARSLAVFQLGESGGGTIVEQARRTRIAGIDDDYADAMALFVAEEHRHAELLACCVRALRGRLIRRNWTARLFVFSRRLIGLRLKVMVLLAAEVVGICYYHLLARHLPRGEVSDVLGQISADEEAHLRFHCEFLRRQVRNPLQRTVFTVSWRLLMFAAAMAVLADHRHALLDLGIGRRVAWRRWMRFSRVAERRVVHPVPGSRHRPHLQSYISVSVQAPNTLTETPSRAIDAVRMPVISSMTKLNARPPSMPWR